MPISTAQKCHWTSPLERTTLVRTPSLLACLHEMGYTAFWHLPAFFNPDNFAKNLGDVHAVGYFDNGGPFLFCNGLAINMLCVPKSLGIRFDGLMEATDIQEHPLARGANRFHDAVG
ncbi:MAG: hypothetical protein EXR07_08015 [Acetobacteraceae bacterium]|nr:hypothetical protein [Acetobacteraceae bacterium]